MIIQFKRAVSFLRSVTRVHPGPELAESLAPKLHQSPPKVPNNSAMSGAAIESRWAMLPAANAQHELLDPHTRDQAACYARSIENFVGTVKVPVGVIGPLRVNGVAAQGDYYVPLATTEAALVASYGRGARLLSAVGGCSAVTLRTGITRAPGFAFRSLDEAGRFVAWVLGAIPTLTRVAATTSRFVRLQDTQVSAEGNHVYLLFDFHTGDAAGQNMATIATQAICDHIRRESPVQPRYAFLEANHSGDKKASAQSFMMGRGRSVTAEAVIPRVLVEAQLRTTPEMMANYFKMAALGGVLSGTIGVQGHFANGLAALFLACGQDVACVAEAATGVTRLEVSDDGALYASVTLPSLPVGTVGGGTALPSQRACLDLLGLAGAGHANAFAEVCAAVVLGGEISIVGALASDEFTRAHQRLARGREATAGPRAGDAFGPADPPHTARAIATPAGG